MKEKYLCELLFLLILITIVIFLVLFGFYELLCNIFSK